MGYGAPGADACSSDSTWDCYMPPIPSGSVSTPTRILGAAYNSGCSTKPQLWGTERPEVILNLDGSSYVEVQCLEITDHSSCVESQQTASACSRSSYPFGTWAPTGMYAEDSTSVLLKNLDIHGLATQGIHAGRLTDWTLDTVRIAGNGWVGWDGDIDGSDSNSGTLKFTRLKVEWNGCGETYPGLAPTNCWGQTAGGYGDGFGVSYTVGHWIFEDSTFQYNTSDGLDLLYAMPGSQIEIRRCLARGNAGNAFKTNGPAVIENSIVIGDCSYHQGQSFTYDFTWYDTDHGVWVTQGSVDPCRAYGESVSITLYVGDQATVMNSTITGEGPSLIYAECERTSTCSGTEKVTLRNNLFVGAARYDLSSQASSMIYQELFPSDPFDTDYSIAYGVADGTCPSATHNQCSTDPGVTNSTLSSFDARLTASSPAINTGTSTGAPTTDYAGTARDSQPDIGAYEYGSGAGGLAPTNLVATGSGTSAVNVSWTAASGALSYDLERKSGSGAFQALVSGSGVSYSDTSVTASNAYAYRVRAVFTGGSVSGYSNTDLATTYSFSTIAAGGTVSVTHLSQLRQAIASARTTAGLTAYTWTDFLLIPYSTSIRRAHLIDLRTALDAVRAQLAMSTLSYTDSTITAGSTSVRAVHFTELRNGVQ
ncbi:MAG: fibronectin type III domain-containing protein [Thermoanaerobaculia bacterium]